MSFNDNKSCGEINGRGYKGVGDTMGWGKGDMFMYLQTIG